jgi:two-component system, NarL family, response regulator DevR
MSSALPLRVVIVDDHEVVREGLRLTFSDHPWVEVVGVFATGAEAISRSARLRPDVALVDYRLPDIEGDELCARLREASPRTLVVLVTSFVSADRIRAAVDAGAFGYVTKDKGLAAVTEILAEARAAHLGTRHADTTPAASFLLRVLREEAEQRERFQLTAQQQRVLELAVEGRTDREIGEALCVSESTVRYHLQRLKLRLGARSKVELVRRAYAAGLIDASTEDGDTLARRAAG